MDSIRAIFDTTLVCQDPTLENFNMNIRFIFFLHTLNTRMFFLSSQPFL